MEFMLSELRGNGVVINEHVFKYQMNKIIENCGESYEELMSRVTAEEEDLKDIFYATNINSDGRERSTMAYKGGHFEKDLLARLHIPSLNLECFGCSKVGELIDQMIWVETCGNHTMCNAYLHCLVRRWRWRHVVSG